MVRISGAGAAIPGEAADVVVDAVAGVAAIVGGALDAGFVATSLVDESRAVGRRLEPAVDAAGARAGVATGCETRGVRLEDDVGAGVADDAAPDDIGGVDTAVDAIAGDDIAAVSSFAGTGTGVGVMMDGLVVDAGACNPFVALGMTCSGSSNTNVPAATAATAMIRPVPNGDDGRDDVD